jgi:catechol 2,3-dioxygenase-like lactoylglutathione lyase family enzyme
MKYVCSLIVVENIERSREFYEKTLKQRVKFDFGANVTFEGGFAIHLREHFEKITKGKSSRSILYGSNSFELYFETEKMDGIYNELKNQNVEFVHEIEEQPWGQRVLRFYDPDKHIVEIGETMEAVVIRFYKQGHSIDEIVNKSSMPKEFIEMTLKNLNT